MISGGGVGVAGNEFEIDWGTRSRLISVEVEGRVSGALFAMSNVH